MSKLYRVKVQEDAEGKFLEIPKEILKAMKWKVGDELQFDERIDVRTDEKCFIVTKRAGSSNG